MTNATSVFANKKMLGRAIKDAFIKLYPKNQSQNPLILLFYLSSYLTNIQII